MLSTPDGYSIKLPFLNTNCSRFWSPIAPHPSTDYLLSRIWGQYADADRRLLTNLVYRLRQKLEAEPIRIKNIRTVEGVGYVYD